MGQTQRYERQNRREDSAVRRLDYDLVLYRYPWSWYFGRLTGAWSNAEGWRGEDQDEDGWGGYLNIYRD